MTSRHIACLWILSALAGSMVIASSPSAHAQSAHAQSAETATAPVMSKGSPVVASAPSPAEVDAAACAKPKVKSAPPIQKPFYEKLLPIALLLIVIGVVVTRLPRVELGHSIAFRRRRLINWLVLGLTYSFLYMARYNLNQFKYVGGLTEAQFGTIFGWGSATYGIAFLLNGPLTDRWGGKTTILIAAGGAAITNLLMGYMIATGTSPFGTAFQTMLVLYCANMYFQSFGAVSIVKVNGAWFHLRERGTFGGIFGILISLGLFFAYDGGKMITDALTKDAQGMLQGLEWLFYIPSGILILFFALCWMFVRSTPSQAGLEDFDLGDASLPDDGKKESAPAVIWRLLSNPIILTIAVIELCSGFLRQGILQWGRDFSSGIGLGHSFVIENWGVVSCIAGITGGMFAGAISDHLFQSRRGPVAAVLYSLMLAGAVAIIPLLLLTDAAFDVTNVPFQLRIIPWLIAFMSMAIIGVHGMLSGTASADFGGRKNTGTAVGIIDGFVYAGSMIQSFIYGAYLPEKLIICADATTRPNPAAKLIDNWRIWPLAMIPVAAIGLVLALRLWNARAKPKSAA